MLHLMKVKTINGFMFLETVRLSINVGAVGVGGLHSVVRT
jgi:hypothetical protein